MQTERQSRTLQILGDGLVQMGGRKAVLVVGLRRGRFVHVLSGEWEGGGGRFGFVYSDVPPSPPLRPPPLLCLLAMT
jgi:hypothetical protein